MIVCCYYEIQRNVLKQKTCCDFYLNHIARFFLQNYHSTRGQCASNYQFNYSALPGWSPEHSHNYIISVFVANKINNINSNLLGFNLKACLDCWLN